MLNYLLAQMIRLKVVSDADPLRNVHSLYSQLFQLVIRRRHRSPLGAPTTEAIDRLDEVELYRALEEIAVCAWHAGSRSVTEVAVRRRFEGERLTGLLSRLTGESLTAQSKGLSIILDSFFCSPLSGSEEKTFEWNHKSFGEYLTARRIRREVEETCRRLTALNEEETHEAVLKRWLALCGPIRLDHDLLNMLRAELAAFEPQRCRSWKWILTGLLQRVMDLGFRLDASQRTKESFRQALNTEIALLACLNGCALALPVDDPDRCIALNFMMPQSASWLHYILGTPFHLSVARKCLSFVNLNGSSLPLVDLFGTDLTEAGLTNSDLANADLSWAVLTNAHLSGTILSGAKLRGADLTDADLTNAYLTYADLTNADLTDADLAGADLTGTNLSDANLTDANLKGANLTGANLRGADLRGADLTGARLKGANLSGASLEGTVGLKRRKTSTRQQSMDG